MNRCATFKGKKRVAQPLTANTCYAIAPGFATFYFRKASSKTSCIRNPLVRQAKLGVSYIVTCQTKVDGKSISGKD